MNPTSSLGGRLNCNSLIFLFMGNWSGHSIPFSTSCIAFHLPFCWLFFVCFLFTCLRLWFSLSPKPVKGWLHFIIEFKRPHGAGTYAISEPEALVWISFLHRQFKNLRNFGYLLLLVFFFNIKSLFHTRPYNSERKTLSKTTYTVLSF